MEAPTVTLCTVAYHAADAVALMWESYCRYHPRPVLHAWDNGSTDGAAEYLRERADLYLEGDNSLEHGMYLDVLCGRVTTPWTLVVDTDVEFLGEVVPRMQAERAFAVCGVPFVQPWKSNFIDRVLYPTDRIDPCCALFRTRELQRLLRYCTFGTYIMRHRGEYFDCGGMLLRMAQAADLPVARVGWLWEWVHHWGSVTFAFHPETPSAKRPEYLERYWALQERLEAFRKEGEPCDVS